MYYNAKWIMPLNAIALTVLLMGLSQISCAQFVDPPIEVTYNKTTSIVFPAIITSVDRGSRDLLAQKAKGVDNILQLKAAYKGFPQTNLTVITADGNIREFTIEYVDEPTEKIIRLNDSFNTPLSLGRGVGGEGDNRIIFTSALTESEMEACASNIVSAKKKIRRQRTSKYKMSLALQGVYVKNDILFCHLHLINNSHVNYDVDFMRFYIVDKQTVRRTASQEINKTPIYEWGETQKIKGQTSTDAVYAFFKFTIPDKKRFVVELFEQEGGRHLKLFIKNKTLVNARLIR